MGFRVLIAGQSNLDEWFHVDGGAPLQRFADRLLQARPELGSVEFFDAAAGGSNLLRTYADLRADQMESDERADATRVNHWYDQETDQPGALLQSFLPRIEDAVAEDGTFDLLLWAQGEADTPFVTSVSQQAYKASLGTVLESLRDASGTDQILIQGLGDRSNYFAPLQAGGAYIKQAQAELAADDPTIRLATAAYDLELRDSVHFATEGYLEAADRLADAWLSGRDAPSVVAAHQQDDRIFLELDLADGEALTHVGSAEGFLSAMRRARLMSPVSARPDGGWC